MRDYPGFGAQTGAGAVRAGYFVSDRIVLRRGYFEAVSGRAAVRSRATSSAP